MYAIPRFVRRVLVVALMTIPFAFLFSCEDTEAPELPSSISISSGDGQYSKRGTEVPDPLAVHVTYSDGEPASGTTVQFRVVSGAGTLNPRNAVVNTRGVASTRLTLGDVLGDIKVHASIATDNSRFVEFSATAGEFFCPEEDPTFSRKFDDQGNLFLFTRKSRLNEQAGQTVAGIVRIITDIPGGQFTASSIKRYDEDFTSIVPRDAAFSKAGDFYIAWKYDQNEILKLSPDFSTSHFATLESITAEITGTPHGVLVGCDEMGPFVAGCRDTLQRFSEALYSGGLGDDVSNDAVAVDPNSEDIYFIYKPDATLRRLPVDTLVATGAVETVAQLTRDEADGANGMVCDDDGTVYILVDRPATKAIVSVTSAGTKSTVYDFFDRGAGDAAGIQDDLASWRVAPNELLLYTVDTKNDVLLVYRITEQVQELIVLVPESGTDPEAISTTTSEDERVGLVLLP